MAVELKLNTTSVPHENVSYKTLQTAAEMFTYLNYCPSLIPKHFLFYAELLKTGTPREITLALTSIIKTVKDANINKQTIKNFRKWMESLRLLDFENIQILTKGKCYTNENFENCKQKINETNKETLGYFIHEILITTYKFCRIQKT